MPKSATRFHRPNRALFWMLVFVGALAAVLAWIYAPLWAAFSANTAFNAVIVGVLLIGLIVIFKQVISLYGEVAWLEEFRRSDPERPLSGSPHYLAPMSRMLAKRDRGQFSLSTGSLRSLLDSIRLRLDESRDLARYLIGLLIFLGLLGTFWGLLATISDVSSVISAMQVDGDGSAIFERLKAGLQDPLDGMAIAFSSSLFGLAGSLVLGFLDLQAGHAQNRFFNEVEEWLASVTRLSSGVLGEGTEASVPAYVEALLEQTADSLERLQRTVSDQSTMRGDLERQLSELSHRLADLSQHMSNQQLNDDLRQEFRLLNRTLGAALGNPSANKAPNSDRS